jgi:hypothetical protein
MEKVEVVVAHSDRATLRVGDVFVKIDSDQTNLDVEVEAIALAPVPTPQILWRKAPALAIAAVPGEALGVLGEPSPASPAAWAAAGAVIRQLHDAPLPPWPGRILDDIVTELDRECSWLISNAVLPADLVTRNREVAEAAQGDPLWDLASLTLGHEEQLPHLLAGYGPADLDIICAWWSIRSLCNARWLLEHGFDPNTPGAEFDVLRARL